jgi:death-on-curing protein
MRIKKIELLTVDQIIFMNKKIVAQEKQRYVCLDKDKIDSALAAAFYPGNYPFQYGGIAKVAGALCYFLTKAHAFLDGNKRTAGIAATVFMDLNHYQLIYPIDEKNDINEFADIIDHAAANKISKDQLITWFDRHKRPHS